MIRAMVSVQNKDYVDRGVQTDLPRQLSRPNSSTSKPVNPRIYDPPSSPVTPPNLSNPGRFIRSPCFDIVHRPSAENNSFPASTGPTRSPPTSRKHPQLPYSRPSQLNGSTQRVLSLPETVPPYPTHFPREARGASLSERPRASLSFSDNTAETSASAETSFRSENRSGSTHARRSFPSSDMPHTPSPPSSPESVMIIGSSDMKVPISFLRQKAAASNEIYEDDGWISWASSPPRPIPALHGPLSLPYARCPSGAEGTITEGEDISRMVWGLGVDDAGNHSRTNSAHGNSYKSTPQSSYPPRLQAQRQPHTSNVSHQHHNLSPRHQRQTSNDHLHPLATSAVNSATGAIRDVRNKVLLHQRALQSLGPRHSSSIQSHDHGRLNAPYNPDSWTDDLLGSLQDQLRTYDGRQGLGLDWQETLRHQHEANVEVARKVNLKPSAPVFVPANQQATQPFPRIFVEPRIPVHTIKPTPRLSAIEIAQQYRAQHFPQSSLPTPPGSSSPQWTPRLPNYTDPFPPLDLHNLLPRKQPISAQQQFLRELQQHPSDPSEELRQFVFDRIRNPDLNVLHNRVGDSLHTFNPNPIDQKQPITPHLGSAASQYRNSVIDASPPHPRPPPNTPISSSRPITRNFVVAPPSPTSPDLRIQNRNHTRPPRSVPFARLLQRRLSTVPEEESGQYVEPYSPPLSPPKAATTTRAPRPPSYSLSDSFQSRSQPPPGFRYSNAPSSAADVLAPQTRTAGELEVQTDEARWKMPSSSRGKAMATVKLPLNMANSDVVDSRREQSSKAASASETLWEKENGKPKKKARSKRLKGGNESDRYFDAVQDTVSPWFAASQSLEAWLS